MFFAFDLFEIDREDLRPDAAEVGPVDAALMGERLPAQPALGVRAAQLNKRCYRNCATDLI
jgi:hypothetical protein